jgi:hypothetical protein
LLEIAYRRGGLLGGTAAPAVGDGRANLGVRLVDRVGQAGGGVVPGLLAGANCCTAAWICWWVRLSKISTVDA